MGDSHVGQHARLMSQALRKLAGIIAKTNCIIIFINQLREKIGVMYGNPETTTGGRALKFYASMRIDVRRIEQIKVAGAGGQTFVGSRTRAKIVKNKVAPPFKEAEFDIIYGEGISKVGEILDTGVKYDICKKGGAWFYYGEIRLGQGRENAKKYLKENPDMMAEIEAKIKEKLLADDEDNTKAAAPKAEPKAAAKASAKAAPASTTRKSSAEIDIIVDDEDE